MKNFNEIYENVYKENLNKLKEIKEKQKVSQRVNLISSAVIPALIYIVAYIPFIFLTLRTNPSMQKFYMIMGIIPYLYIVRTIYKKDITVKIQKQNTYKNQIIYSFIRNFDKNLVYEKSGKASDTDYRNSEFSDNNKIYHSEDYVSGIIDNDIVVNLNDIRITQAKKDVNGNMYESTVYQGLFYTTDLTINIPSRIKIYSKPINNQEQPQSSLANTELKTDSTEFNNHFVIYTQNKIEAMQVLTSDIMKALLKFKKTINKKLDISITGNKLYIRLNYTKMFEPPENTQNMIDQETLYQYYLIFRFLIEISEKLRKSLENSNSKN